VAQRAAVERAKADTDAYIREVAGKSPADQIAGAKALLDLVRSTKTSNERFKAKAPA